VRAAVAATPFAPSQTLASSEVRYSKAYVIVAVGFILVTLGRVHEVIPYLQPFRLGMLSTVLVVLLSVTVLRRDLLGEFASTPVFKGLFLVLLMSFATIPTAVWPGASFKFLTDVFYTPVILLLVAALTFADHRAMRIVLLALAADALLAGFMSLFAPVGRYEIGSTYDPNETAALLLLVIPWAIYVLVSEKNWFRWVALLAIPFCLLGVLKTGSRGGLLSAAALVPFLLYLSPPKRRGPFIVFIGIAAVITTASVGPRTWYRLKLAFDPTEYNYTTEDGRIEIWKRGLTYIAGAPLHGLGIDGFPYKELATKTDKGYGVRQAAAHNMYLQVGSELGLIGFTGFMTMLLGGLAIARRVAKRAREWSRNGGGAEADRELLRANMAQASLFTTMCTGFFLSMGYSSMVYFSAGAAAGVWLASKHRGVGPGSPGVPSPQPRRSVRGMRGWRSARTIPVLPGVQASERPST
jgi:O-antigen ligase